MSRTIRRKNIAKQVWLIPEDREYWRTVYSDGLTYQQYKAKTKAEFHSDKDRQWGYRASLPRWVRNKCQERPFRAWTLSQMRKVLHDVEAWENLSYRRPLKDAWLYY